MIAQNIGQSAGASQEYSCLRLIGDAQPGQNRTAGPYPAVTTIKWRFFLTVIVDGYSVSVQEEFPWYLLLHRPCRNAAKAAVVTDGIWARS
jgi:hypothetical protein